ncbi:hypothetical protein KJS94_17035 [Flavihumibacter rivuli]|uniref:hypothetical protein n=1 Tax=Flavihumibacter rivuli TaxID=2838156 RepID=UPI001BDEB3EB|nr:hypothetical protein [Flavihumibacter rivuli]ULQ56357.1 hypothetical protein KJS94_17035 [Flavihumibacter rivuli]
MKRLLYSILSMLSMLAMACGERPDGRVKGASLYPELVLTDSVQVIYYDTLGEERNFTFFSSTDTSIIAPVVKDASAMTIDTTTCPKEGKIYCFVKGNIYTTIYFSTGKGGCSPHFRCIRDAQLYCFSMSERSRELLTGKRSSAVRP